MNLRRIDVLEVAGSSPALVNFSLFIQIYLKNVPSQFSLWFITGYLIIIIIIIKICSAHISTLLGAQGADTEKTWIQTIYNDIKNNIMCWDTCTIKMQLQIYIIFEKLWHKMVYPFMVHPPYCPFPGCIVTWAWSLAKGQYMVSWLLTSAPPPPRTKILTK